MSFNCSRCPRDRCLWRKSHIFSGTCMIWISTSCFLLTVLTICLGDTALKQARPSQTRAVYSYRLFLLLASPSRSCQPTRSSKTLLCPLGLNLQSPSQPLNMGQNAFRIDFPPHRLPSLPTDDSTCVFCPFVLGCPAKIYAPWESDLSSFLFMAALAGTLSDAQDMVAQWVLDEWTYPTFWEITVESVGWGQPWPRRSSDSFEIYAYTSMNLWEGLHFVKTEPSRTVAAKTPEEP